MAEQWRPEDPHPTPTKANAIPIVSTSAHEKSMTDKHVDNAAHPKRLAADEFIDVWLKARLISVEGPLHQFVPKEPGWCQVLGNKLDRIVRKQMSIRPWDEGRALAALQKHVKQLNYVYGIAEARREAHLANGRLRCRQAKDNSKTMRPAE
jgi:hypothetical protein